MKNKVQPKRLNFFSGNIADDEIQVSMRSSNLMFGYNKRGIVLNNRIFISWGELRKALLEYTNAMEKMNISRCVEQGKLFHQKNG